MEEVIDTRIFTPDDFIIINSISDYICLDHLDKKIRLNLLGSDNYAEMELDIIHLTNIERSKFGLKPLTCNGRLCQSALFHTLDMAENRFISHTGSDGTDLKYRINQAGYRGYLIIGENLACGQMTPKQAVQGWMNSPGHRANILRPHYNEIGTAYILGKVSSTDNSTWLDGGYWTQHFGFRPFTVKK
jgi:uncharacterized protein YkwD